MRGKKISLILSLILVLPPFSFFPPAKATENNEIKVGVFYYPWYVNGSGRGHWSDDPRKYGIILTETWWTVVDQPLLNWYASDNIMVIDQHLDWFKYAGVDFGILSWWGPNSNNETMRLVFNETCIKTIFDETERYESRTHYPFKWVVSVEDCNESGAQRYIQDYIYKEYASPNAYANIWLDDASNGKPFLFWFNGKMTNSSSDREAIYNGTRFSAKILDQLKDYADWNTWTPYTWGNATSAFPPKNGFMCVMPRYDETRLDPNGTMGKVRDRCADQYLNGSYWNNTDPLNEPLYDYQWKEVLSNASAGKVQYVGIATWNDFTERTQIEPCYDNTSAYKDYPFFLLDKTRYYTSQLRIISLQVQINSLNNQLNALLDLQYVLAGFVVILVMTTIYLRIRKPRMKQMSAKSQKPNAA